jgi:hypothetical protein
MAQGTWYYSGTPIDGHTSGFSYYNTITDARDIGTTWAEVTFTAAILIISLVLPWAGLASFGTFYGEYYDYMFVNQPSLTWVYFTIVAYKKVVGNTNYYKYITDFYSSGPNTGYVGTYTNYAKLVNH